MIEIHEQVYQDAVELVTNQYSERYPNRSLTSVGSLKDIRFRAAGRAEADMWRVVGERVAESMAALDALFKVPRVPSRSVAQVLS